MNRRKFLESSLKTTGGIGMATILPASVVLGKPAPSDKINVALIGSRNMGFGILNRHLEQPDANCVAMCDVDQNVLNERAAEIKNKYQMDPKLFGDYRKVLDRKDVDAVIIGTPDHWHCKIMVDAVKAGKDVYVEKPMANTIEECNVMVDAARKYNRVVQVGQQQRSNKIFLKAMDMIKSGQIGNLRKVNVWANFNYGVGPEPVPDSEVPAGVDYETWLGPAPKRPFNQNRFHGSWRHFWDYGGGLMSDWGVHLLDMALWARDLKEGPKQVMVYAANTFADKRQRETFDTMNVLYPKDDFLINWNMTAGIQTGPYNTPYGLAFVGDKATLVTTRKTLEIFLEGNDGAQKSKAEEVNVYDGHESHGEHVRNFMDCVKSRETPNCPPETGRAAAVHALIPNIAGRVGASTLTWDNKQSKFTDNTKANELVKAYYRKPYELPKV
jgi:predicted dehydrogenase